MSAERLREAAALMRSRAEATEPTYEAGWPRRDIEQHGTCDGCSMEADLVAAYDGPDSEPWLCADCAASADHETSWHPAVALAVAEVLSFAAETWSDDRCSSSRGHDESCGECGNCERHWTQVRALAVADAYLGDQP